MTTLYSSSIHSSHPPPTPLLATYAIFTSSKFPAIVFTSSKTKTKQKAARTKRALLKKRKKKERKKRKIKVSGERKRALRRLGMSLSAMVVRPSYWEEAVSRAGLLLSAGPSVFPHHHLSGRQSLRALPALCICCRTGWPFFQHCWNGYSVDQSALVVLRQCPHSSTVLRVS